MFNTTNLGRWTGPSAGWTSLRRSSSEAPSQLLLNFPYLPTTARSCSCLPCCALVPRVAKLVLIPFEKNTLMMFIFKTLRLRRPLICIVLRKKKHSDYFPVERNFLLTNLSLSRNFLMTYRVCFCLTIFFRNSHLCSVRTYSIFSFTNSGSLQHVELLQSFPFVLNHNWKKIFSHFSDISPYRTGEFQRHPRRIEIRLHFDWWITGKRTIYLSVSNFVLPIFSIHE